MSVVGIGVDLVDLARFEEQLRLDGTRFREHFTPAERELHPTAAARADEHLAARWAAKEAFVKAWSVARIGTPPQLTAVDLREIEVVRDAWGRPTLRLHGEVERAVGEAFDDYSVHLSLSHDAGTAVAMVVIER